ncbi:GLPGLI family protein [uncultured Polaribacter sp.]|uniref:GLPGLI family protein n=1 Tax=uncultured Polaribacter sp. TaxID=174711 RepID=UPI00260B4D43|nr:GLPGLI family protein [uncultured Polaribacter sp.]
MRKKLLLLIFVFLNTIVNTQNISGKVTYVVSMTPISDKLIDSISNKKGKLKNAKMNKWMRDMLKNTPNVNAYLEFANGESIYYVEDKMFVDGKAKFNINRTSAGGDNKTYKNTKTKEYLRENVRENLLIELYERKWKITQESKQIGSYLCFKAIDIESTNTKMKPVVWFTPQIPVSFGPKEFTGLPGLVVLVEMYNRTISASKITLNPKEKIKMKKLIKGERITEEKYNKKMKALWNNLEKKRQ